MRLFQRLLLEKATPYELPSQAWICFQKPFGKRELNPSSRPHFCIARLAKHVVRIINKGFPTTLLSLISPNFMRKDADAVVANSGGTNEFGS